MVRIWVTLKNLNSWTMEKPLQKVPTNISHQAVHNCLYHSAYPKISRKYIENIQCWDIYNAWGRVYIKKWIFKLLRLSCCWVSKFVPQDAWPTQIGIGSIRSLRAEKTNKCGEKIHIYQKRAKLFKLDHILYIFSGLGDQIELIPFWEGHASCNAGLDT